MNGIPAESVKVKERPFYPYFSLNLSTINIADLLTIKFFTQQIDLHTPLLVSKIFHRNTETVLNYNKPPAVCYTNPTVY